MLEVRYKKDTGAITAWAGSPGFTGGHLKPKDGENITVLDSPTPDGKSSDYLIVDGKLVYTRPEPARDLAVELDALKAKIEKLEKK